MPDLKQALLLTLAIFAVYFAWVLRRGLRWARTQGPLAPGARELAIGAGTNFFDTLGIGSFATTTSIFKLWRVVDDRVIPGTLNVGHTAPSIVQAFIYIAIVRVDVPTLVSMIAAAVAGAWLGAGMVARWPRRKVQIGMGCCLVGAATLMLASQLRLVPAGGEAIGLAGPALAVGLLGNFVFGALMTLGIGLYGPCLILVSLLGMSPAAAFPIMMGACAFLMPVASARFIAADAWAPRAALGLTLGGIPCVLLAAYLVKSLPLSAVRWLVVVAVAYTAFALLASARRERAAQVAVAAAAAEA